jgi:glucosamine-6-phosphate deaminase
MTHDPTEFEQRERIKSFIHGSADEACRLIAEEIRGLIRTNDAAGRKTVLGLATGSTPVRLYQQLIRMHREEGLSFRNVITFNLDEYQGLSREHPESYWRFMHDQLFRHIDLPAEAINLPDGTLARGEIFAACAAYEAKIKALGGIDLQVLGIGRTGHIGFNEPGSGRESRTRLVTLDSLTRRDAARDFRGELNVPRYAITMGVGTIRDARRVRLLAWGAAKAGVVAQAVEAAPSDTLPASLLQGHDDVAFHLDPAAASELTRARLPWLVGPVAWTPAIARRAVVWLSLHLQKPILKLVDEEYGENGMADLLTEQGPAYEVNIRIFNQVQHTITGWPGGKPTADDSHRPERATPFPKRVLVLSPEPCDDTLGMGGTLRRLVRQGHAVTVAYLTSGNLAVPDEDAEMAADLMLELAQDDKGLGAGKADFAWGVREQLLSRGAFAVDSDEVRRLKGLLRRGEARSALRVLGLPAERLRFLDLPFYEKGKYRQFRLGPADLQAVSALLDEVQPHQIFVTGQAADPSSLSAVCFGLLRQALATTRAESWPKDCRIWLFAGTDRPWEPAEVDMAVPLSPHELSEKIGAMHHHKSQRGQAAALAHGTNELWQQAERQNRRLAELYDHLGLANYEAIEAFQRWIP